MSLPWGHRFQLVLTIRAPEPDPATRWHSDLRVEILQPAQQLSRWALALVPRHQAVPVKRVGCTLLTHCSMRSSPPKTYLPDSLPRGQVWGCPSNPQSSAKPEGYQVNARDFR